MAPMSFRHSAVLYMFVLKITLLVFWAFFDGTSCFVYNNTTHRRHLQCKQTIAPKIYSILTTYNTTHEFFIHLLKTSTLYNTAMLTQE